MQSLPSRERGLKSVLVDNPNITAVVAPLAGAWIEIGVHLETDRGQIMSLPSRERGLK